MLHSGKITAALLLLTLYFPACREHRTDTVQREQTMTRPVSEVIKDNSARLLAIEGVVGVYEGTLEGGEPCITLMVTRDRPGLRKEVPSVLDGYPVRLEIGGEIRPMH